MSRFLVALATLLLSSMLLLAACDGNGDNGDDGDDQPEATAPMDGDEGDDADGGDEPDDSGGATNEELQRFIDEFANQEFRADYTFSSSSNGETQEGSMTLFWRPPDSWRMDIADETGGGTLISTAEASYFCSEAEGFGQCIESDAGAALPLPFVDVFTDPDSLSDLVDASLPGVDLEESSRDIAGQSATCFSVSGDIDGESGQAEYCFGDSGVLLLLKVSGGGIGGSGEFSLEATSVEDSVPADAFEPPYEVLDISGIE